MKTLKVIALSILLLTASGCNLGLVQMGTTEYGLRFRKYLPPALGGGLASKVIKPGEAVIIWPWDELYRLDTSLQYIDWGAKGQGTDKERVDYVATRALDGNEVALAVTVQYRVTREPKKILHLMRTVASSNLEVAEIVSTVARADIRTFMNELKTSSFFVRDDRYKAIEKVKVNMSNRLSPLGIEVVSVILNEHRFERTLPDSSVDSSYQQRIDETQRLREDTEREKLRIATIRARKEQEFNDTQAKVNRLVAEADGYLEQAKSRGQSYFEARSNEAKAIYAKGKADAEGIAEQVKAYRGAGGRSLLKLELVKELLKAAPRFVIIDSSNSKNDVNVSKLDANEFLDQVGLFHGLERDMVKKTKSKAAEASE